MRMSRRLFALLPGMLPALLGGCAVATPFRAADTGDPPRGTAVVGVTHAVLVEDRRLRPLFWKHTANVEATLPDQPGFLGHSKRASLLGNEAWTMTVWRSASDMEMFVESHVHVVAIAEAMPAIARAHFARFTVTPDEMPPRWSRALAVLAQRGRSYV
jgi:heme-degrading monooxygenase HmoA